MISPSRCWAAPPRSWVLWLPAEVNRNGGRRGSQCHIPLCPPGWNLSHQLPASSRGKRGILLHCSDTLCPKPQNRDTWLNHCFITCLRIKTHCAFVCISCPLKVGIASNLVLETTLIACFCQHTYMCSLQILSVLRLFELMRYYPMHQLVQWHCISHKHLWIRSAVRGNVPCSALGRTFLLPWCQDPETVSMSQVYFFSWSQWHIHRPRPVLTNSAYITHSRQVQWDYPHDKGDTRPVIRFSFLTCFTLVLNQKQLF